MIHLVTAAHGAEKFYSMEQAEAKEEADGTGAVKDSTADANSSASTLAVAKNNDIDKKDDKTDDTTTSSNTKSARHEGLQEARDLDDRTRRAWEGHRHLYVIDNYLGSDNTGDSSPDSKSTKDITSAKAVDSSKKSSPSSRKSRKKKVATFNEKMHRVVNRVLAVFFVLKVLLQPV